VKHFPAIVLCVISTLAIGQHPDRDYNLEKIAENIFPLQDLDIDYSQLYENLAQILSNPIDLNTATNEQLRSLYILNENQIAGLLNYRKEQGPFLSVYELQTIPEIDQNTFDNLSPFVTVKSDQTQLGSLAKRVFNEQNNYFLIRYNRTLESKRGYQSDSTLPANYNGSPDRVYNRFRVARASDFSIGFTLEKDPGERVRWSPKNNWYGFDYNSYHIQVLNKGPVRNLILGDYQAQFGQGLVLGGGFGVGKGSETITTIRRSNVGFLPYTSLNESGFFRGVAFSIQPLKRMAINSFFSRRLVDGSPADSTGQSLSSILSSGLHRTQNEITNRKTVTENNYGLVANYKSQSLEFGSMVHHTSFSIPINRNPTVYNQFYFQGAANTNVSLYLNYAWNNTTLFTEAAHTINHGNAYVLGTLTSVTPQFDLALSYRHYDRDFQSLYGNALAENSTVQNETGYYLGWKYKFNKQHSLAGYSDIFHFPWLRYRGYAPSNGHEWLVRYNYQPSKQVVFYIQAREESKIRNHSESTNLYITENGIKRNFLINLDYEINKQLSFKSRIQHSSYSFETSKTTGLVLIQDFNFKLKKFRFSTRYALFDTDDYDNRQYVYERDVWLAYSFPAYYGMGVRSYILAQYSLTQDVDIWVRWSRTKYENRDTIGSGDETIAGNSMNDVKFQVRIIF